MKFQTEELKKVIRKVRGAVEKHPYSPAFAGIMISPGENDAVITTVGHTVAMRTQCPMIHRNESDMAVLVPSHILIPFVMNGTAETLGIIREGNSAVMKCGRAKARVAVIADAAMLPKPCFDESTPGLDADSKNLTMAIAHVIFAASPLRAQLSGACFYAKDGHVFALATDLYRTSAAPVAEGVFEGYVNIPKEALRAAQKLLAFAEKDEKVHVSFDGTHAHMTCAGCQMTSTVISGMFPVSQIENTMAFPPLFTAKAQKEHIRAVFDRILPFADEDHHSTVKMSLAEDGIHLRASSDIGEYADVLECRIENYPASSWEAAYDIRYLMDAVKHSEGEVSLSFGALKSPARITSENGVSGLILPVRTH